jgi:hypothetical protein
MIRGTVPCTFPSWVEDMGRSLIGRLVALREGPRVTDGYQDETLRR